MQQQPAIQFSTNGPPPLAMWIPMFSRRVNLLVDLIGLGVGGLLTVSYLLASDSIAESSSVKAIWSNLGTEILGVWLSVRVIGAVLSERDERKRVRDSVIGNINFMMGICQRLPPYFDEGTLKDLNNELMWFREKSISRVGGKQLAKNLSVAERTSLSEAIELVIQMNDLAQRARTSRFRFRAAIDGDISWNGPPEVKELINAARQALDGDPSSEEACSRNLSLVHERLLQGGYSETVLSQVKELCATVSTHKAALEQLRDLIVRIEHAIAGLRTSIAESG
jgi:hypothetical protein